MKPLTYNECIELLETMYIVFNELDAFDNKEEKEYFEVLKTRLEPKDRGYLIKLRNDALEASEMGYAVDLSYIISAMTEENFYPTTTSVTTDISSNN